VWWRERSAANVRSSHPASVVAYLIALAITLAVEVPLAGWWLGRVAGPELPVSPWALAGTANLVSHVVAIGLVWPAFDDRVARGPLVLTLELAVWLGEAAAYAAGAAIMWRRSLTISAVANLASLSIGAVLLAR
jgi:hypothetical protein